MGGLWVVSEGPGNECDGDQPILLLWVIISHRCRDTTFQTGTPELGLERKYLVLGPLKVLSEFQVDLQNLLARFDVLS